MEKDYKQMWEELSEFILNLKQKHDEHEKDLSLIGGLLSTAMLAAYKVVLGKMERLETGHFHCPSCGCECEDDGSPAPYCPDCRARAKELDGVLEVSKILFDKDDDDVGDITFGDLKYEGDK